MSVDRTLHRIRDLIVLACDPEAIVLFGSYAKGQQNVSSDIDLIVVADVQGPVFRRTLELRELLHPFPVRIDLHVISTDELEGAPWSPLNFLHSALAGGVVLHATPKGALLLTKAHHSHTLRPVGRT